MKMNTTQKANHEACQQSEREKIFATLEFAPQAHEWCNTTPADLAGFHTCTGLFVCAQCAHRYNVRDKLPRGFMPIYNDQTDRRECEFCEENATGDGQPRTTDK
jgi:hypothetical protein